MQLYTLTVRETRLHRQDNVLLSTSPPDGHRLLHAGVHQRQVYRTFCRHGNNNMAYGSIPAAYNLTRRYSNSDKPTVKVVEPSKFRFRHKNDFITPRTVYTMSSLCHLWWRYASAVWSSNVLLFYTVNDRYVWYLKQDRGSQHVIFSVNTMPLAVPQWVELDEFAFRVFLCMFDI